MARTITPEQRHAVLERLRVAKMARSAHAYVRGATVDFYRWLAELEQPVPQGPPVWICGDCHLGNLGPLADAEGRVDVQIRDLDQTVVGNPAHDLVRLGLSLATAARGSDLPGVTTARMLEEMAAGYDIALRDPEADRDPQEATPEPDVVKAVRREALGRRWRHLAEERIADVEPKIPIGSKFWALTAAEREAIDALFEIEAVQDLVRLTSPGDDDRKVSVVDAAYWRKGCSSLGKLRYAVLVHLKGGGHALMDIKEAPDPPAAPVSPLATAGALPAHAGLRMVAGARALSPNLGDRMVAADLLGRPVVLRELAPQDLKLEVEQFTREEATAAARYLAYVVGRAHARQLDDRARTEWRKALEGARSHDLDAPGWLWSSVVALAARHEAGYLEHCRRYALGTKAA